jgi:hypothetical protein
MPMSVFPTPVGPRSTISVGVDMYIGDTLVQSKDNPISSTGKIIQEKYPISTERHIPNGILFSTKA